MNRKVSVLVAFVLAFVPVGYAQAQEASSYDAKLDSFLSELDGELSREALDEQIQDIANNSDLSKEEVLDYEIWQMQHPDEAPAPVPPTRAAHGDTPLVTANHAGDFFYTDSITFVNHGHTGIYTAQGTVVEAPGPKQSAHSVGASSIKVKKGAVIRRVNTNNTNKDKAAARARTYIGRGYNSAFFNANKDDKGGMNCSQLVWAAWWYGAGIDLDTRNNDDIVWPRDLRDSTKATTYRTI